MCHHLSDRDAAWERMMEEIPEDDPEAQEPEPERETDAGPTEKPTADD